MKKKFNKKKLLTLGILGLFVMAFATAVILDYYGQINQNYDAEQAVVLTCSDGSTGVCDELIEKVYAPDTRLSGLYVLTNNDPENSRDVELVTSSIPETASGEIVTTYLKETGYEKSFSVDIEGSDYDLGVTVAEEGDWMVWTFDFPVEEFTGDGNLNVGLVIATDGEGNGPAFQIHNNDGSTAEFAEGTWLMSPWGPTISDGWLGWHNSEIGGNTQVTDLAWVEATGNRNVPHEAGILQVKILKSELGESFHWATSPTVGSGFWDAYDVTMQIPTAFGWSTPLVDMTTSNYEYAELMEEFTDVTLQSGESLGFVVKNKFMTTNFDGTITTEALPA